MVRARPAVDVDKGYCFDQGVEMSGEVAKFLSDPLVSSTIGIGTFVVSTLVAVYLYIRAKSISRLDYASYDVQILSTRFPNLAQDLEILHKGVPVPEVTGTVAAVWNSGNQTIQESQIVKGDRLRFEVIEGKKILKAHIVATTREVNNTRVTIDPMERYILLEFDYLDEGDGFVMFITHTASLGQCTIGGTVRGVRQGPRLQRVSRFSRLMAPILTMALMLLLILILSLAHIEITLWATVLILIFVTAVPVFVPNLLVFQRVRSFPRELRENTSTKGLIPFLLQGDVN